MEKERLNALTLKELTLRKVSVLLWSTEENLNLINEFRFGKIPEANKYDSWNNLINKVVIQVTKLELPESVKTILRPLLKPIGWEILKWKSFQENYLHKFLGDSIHCLDVLSWSSDGVIEYSKTANNIVRIKPLNMVARYQLACLFCLENDIPVLWRMLNKKEKESCTGNYEDNPYSVILSFWTYKHNFDLNVLEWMYGGSTDNQSVFQYAFVHAATNGNYVATQYFFPKLTFAERAESLVRATLKVAEKISFMITIKPDGVPRESYRDILCYLLIHMVDEERSQIFRVHSLIILRCFLDWPWQSMFLGVLKGLLLDDYHYITEDDYHVLLYILVRNFNLSAYNYSKLFQEVFQLTPMSYMKYALEQQCTLEDGSFFTRLFLNNDVESIVVVLRSVDFSAKERLFICDSGFEICYALIRKNKWHLLELFIQECKLSNEVRSKIKDNFIQFLDRVYDKTIDGRNQKCIRFFCMVQQTVVIKSNKKKSKKRKIKA